MADNSAQQKKTQQLLQEMSKVIVGQDSMNRSLLIGLLTNGHILLEGLPGLAKTLAVKTLANLLDAKFQRIQFTPDLLPSDVLGTMIFRSETNEFVTKKGPIFCNVLLADEINRAPAKVQSALLEGMAERQVTIGDNTYPLDEPFLVFATQNPIEQEGTYRLPEAQLDRFMLKIRVEYPSLSEERQILERMTTTELPKTSQVFPVKNVMELRKLIDQIYVDDRVKDYIVRLVVASRPEAAISEKESRIEKIQELRKMILVGASPRATIFLTKAARAFAFLEGRDFATPDDVKAVALEVMRHRLILTFDSEAKGMNTDQVIRALLETVVVP